MSFIEPFREVGVGNVVDLPEGVTLHEELLNPRDQQAQELLLKLKKLPRDAGKRAITLIEIGEELERYLGRGEEPLGFFAMEPELCTSSQENFALWYSETFTPMGESVLGTRGKRGAWSLPELFGPPGYYRIDRVRCNARDGYLVGLELGCLLNGDLISGNLSSGQYLTAKLSGLRPVANRVPIWVDTSKRSEADLVDFEEFTDKQPEE